jgi:flagellar hook-associated protein 3 FlgL
MQDQITKDKRIVRISDDPSGASLIMDFQTSIERNKMYVKQGEAASSFLKGTETALNTVDIQIDRLLELGQQGLNDLNANRGREAIAAEIDGILTLLYDVSNTKEQGKYIFSGTNTSTQSFTIDPITHSIDYDGNLGNIDLAISSTATITSNLTGELVFQGSRDGGGNLLPEQDLFIQVAGLRDALTAVPYNRADVEDAYNNIRVIKERVNVCLTTVGSRHVQIENSGTNLEDFNESLQSIQNAYDGLDYPWTISQWIAEENSQQAALSIIGRMGRYSLFDYIG